MTWKALSVRPCKSEQSFKNGGSATVAAPKLQDGDKESEFQICYQVLLLQ